MTKLTKHIRAPIRHACESRHSGSLGTSASAPGPLLSQGRRIGAIPNCRHACESRHPGGGAQVPRPLGPCFRRGDASVRPPNVVMPAEAGIQESIATVPRPLGPYFRRGDGVVAATGGGDVFTVVMPAKAGIQESVAPVPRHPPPASDTNTSRVRNQHHATRQTRQESFPTKRPITCRTFHAARDFRQSGHMRCEE